MSIVSAILASWTGRTGLGLLALALLLAAYGSLNAPPARASLSTVEGALSEAHQITRTRTRKGQGRAITGVDFVLTIARQGAAPVKLSLPSDEISREQVQALVGRVVKAEYDGEADVYALTSGGREIVSYDATLKKRQTAAQTWGERGKIALGLAIPLALIGWPLGKRKLAKTVPA